MKRVYLSFALLMSGMLLMAQFETRPQGPQGPQGPPSPRHACSQQECAEVRATRMAIQLRDTLHLDCDQFNEVYKLYLKEYSAMEEQMQANQPPQGGNFGGGMPPQGGCGMPPQGGNFGGGMPPQGGCGMPPSPEQQAVSTEQQKKQDAKRQKKMKSILSEPQYECWLRLDSASHCPPPNWHGQPQQGEVRQR